METAKNSVVKVINRAYELIDTNGWVQGRMVAPPDGFTAQGLFDIEHAIANRCKVCLEAALIIAESEATGKDVRVILDALEENGVTFPAYDTVLGEVNREPQRYEPPHCDRDFSGGHSSLHCFNDRLTPYNKAAVLRALNNAAFNYVNTGDQ